MKLSSIQMIFKRLTEGQEESSATVPDGSLPSMFEQNWCLYLTHKRTIPSLFLCAGISGSVLCLCPKLDQVLLKGSGFSPSQSASGTKKFFLGPVFLKCASNLCSILMEAYSTGVWGIYNHFISTCWHKTSCTHTHTQTQSESDGDSNEGLGLQCRWCGVTENTHRIRFTPTESPSTSTSHLFLFHKTRKEDDTSESIHPLSLFLSCTKKSRGERRRRRDLRLLTYSDGVSSPHQSRMAANPLLCFYRKGKRGRRGSERCDRVYLHSGGKL